jgi:hypothetical protein
MFGSRATSKAVKIKICKTMVKPIIVYGSETWAVTEVEEKNIKKDMWISGTGRNMRTRTNQELRELYKDLDIVAGIKNEDWNGWVREGQLKYWQVNRRVVEEAEELD